MLTAFEVQDVPLVCLCFRPVHLRNPLACSLWNSLFCLLVFHLRTPRTRFHIRPNIHPDDLCVDDLNLYTEHEPANARTVYELLYTSIGQAIATYAPNEYFASLMNPIILGAGLITFCGIVVPYSQITAFWRYWIYWLDPFSYLVGGLLTQLLWDVRVQCKQNEITTIPLPTNSTCGQYMGNFLSENAGYVVDPSSATSCEYCPYKTGAEYAKTLNLNAKYYGWRDFGITVLFCISSYAMVFCMMKLRSKATKKASG